MRGGFAESGLSACDGETTLARMRPTTNTKTSPVRLARERVGLTREQLAVKAGVGSTILNVNM